MNEVTGIVTLEYVVKQVFEMLETYSQRKFLHFMNIARKGLIELNTHVIKDVTTIVLPIDADTFTVNLPKDFMNYYTIGLIRNNQVYPLARNDSIPMVLDEHCGEESYEFKRALLTKDVPPRSVGKAYSFSGGITPLMFRVDYKNRKIFLQGASLSDSIVLEYISTGIGKDVKVYIPRYIAPALEEWIHWKRIEYNPTVAYNEKERRKRSYYEEVGKLNRVRRSLRTSEIMDALHSASQSTPKR